MDEELQTLLEHPGYSIQPTETSKKVWPYSICIPLGIYILCVAMVVGVLPQWMLLYLCSRFSTAAPNDFSLSYLPGFFHTPIINPEPVWETCSALPEIQAMSAKWTMVIGLCTKIPSLILGPFYGALSDSIGRKPMILLAMNCVLIFFSAYLSIAIFDFGLWMLLFTNLVVGLLGGYMNMANVMMAYFSDTTTALNRNTVFVVGQSVLFGAFSCGPLLGGILARGFSNGTFKVLVLAFLLALIIMLLTAAFLPESLAVKKDRAPVLSVRASAIGLIKLLEQFKSSTLLILLAVTCLNSAATSGQILFFNYVSFKFAWDAQDEGQYMLVSGVSQLFQMLLVFPFLTFAFKKLRSTKLGKATFDLGLIRLGTFFSGIGSVFLAVAERSELIYVIKVFTSFSALASPTLQSVLSLSISPDNQGVLFSGISFLGQCIGLISGVLFPQLWAKTVKSNPNAFLFVIAAIHLLENIVLTYPNSEDIADSEINEDALNEEEEMVVDLERT